MSWQKRGIIEIMACGEVLLATAAKGCLARYCVYCLWMKMMLPLVDTIPMEWEGSGIADLCFFLLLWVLPLLCW